MIQIAPAYQRDETLGLPRLDSDILHACGVTNKTFSNIHPFLFPSRTRREKSSDSARTPEPDLPRNNKNIRYLCFGKQVEKEVLPGFEPGLRET